jgi:hypothetical protein
MIPWLLVRIASPLSSAILHAPPLFPGSSPLGTGRVRCRVASWELANWCTTIINTNSGRLVARLTSFFVVIKTLDNGPPVASFSLSQKIQPRLC